MSLKNVNHQKRSFTWSMEKPSAKVLKCSFILFFSDRTKDVFQNLCGGLSGDIFHNAYFIRTYGSTCSKAENTCKAVYTACLSCTDSVRYRPSAAKGKRRNRDS